MRTFLPLVVLCSLIAGSALAAPCSIQISDPANKIEYRLDARTIGKTAKNEFPKVFEVTWTDEKTSKVFSTQGDVFVDAGSLMVSNGEFLFGNNMSYAALTADWAKDVAELKSKGRSGSYFRYDSRKASCSDDELALLMFEYYSYLH